MTQQFRAQVPWRTRGTVDPNVGVPVQANVSVLPQDPILINDAFVIVGAAATSVTNGLLGAVPGGGIVPGGYVVYNGGTVGAWAGWTYVAQSPSSTPNPMDEGLDTDLPVPYQIVIGQRSPAVE